MDDLAAMNTSNPDAVLSSLGADKVKSKTLFERNIEYFIQKNYHFAAILGRDYIPQARPVLAGDVWDAQILPPLLSLEDLNQLERPIVNLDLGGRLLYQKEAKDYHQEQLKRFQKKPIRLDCGTAGFGSPHLRSNQMFFKIRTESLKFGTGTKLAAKNQFNDEIMVSYGVGLGTHIAEMIEIFDLRILLLIENYMDFLYYSSFMIDWREIDNRLTQRGGVLEIVAHTSPDSLKRRYVQRIRDIALNQLHGMLLLEHYHALFVASCHEYLMDNMSYAMANMGFFEDELVMMVNSIQNLHYSNPSRYWRLKRHLVKEHPVLVVGSGPSLDDSIEWLRQVQDKAVIIACGTALGTLLKAGIKPDFTTLVENTLLQAEVIDLAKKHGSLDDIVLVASTSVFHKAVRSFQHRILYIREMITFASMMADKIRDISMAGPMVNNLALRFAVSVGFQNIYLIGVDMGSKRKTFHSKLSQYYEHEEGLKHEASFEKLKDRLPGNFGGQARASTVLDFARFFTTALTRTYQTIHFYNCSDGVYIDGFTPILPHVASRKWKLGNKRISVKEVMDNIDIVENGRETFLDSLALMRRHIRRFVAEAVADLQTTEQYAQFIGRLDHHFIHKPLVMEKAVFVSAARGTIYIEIASVNFCRRAMQKEAFQRFFPTIKKIIIEEIEDMGRMFIEMLTICETNDLEKLEADAYRLEGTLHPYIQEKDLPKRLELIEITKKYINS